MVALAQVLSYVKLFELPQGGSVGIGMLPIFIYCARWGFGPGMLASVVYSFLQLMFDGGFAIGWQSVLGDYIIAYLRARRCRAFPQEQVRPAHRHCSRLRGALPRALHRRRDGGANICRTPSSA